MFSKSFEEHFGRLTNVFQALRQAGLTLQFKKCHFAQRQVRYLGHVASAAGIHPDPAKTEAVSTYPVPNNTIELRQFLGLAKYYHRFVAEYSKIAEPLHKLLTKETSFSWDSKCHNAFEELKHKLVSPPILAFPDFSKQFVLCTDTSDTAIGGVLSQNQDGQERVISYWSRQLQKAEWNYSTIEKEALAAVAAIKEFYPYLYGLNFKLVTDYNPLTSLKGLKDVGGCLTRWMIFLQQFNFQFEYKPGKNHGNAVKALEKGEPLPVSSAPGLRKTFLQNGLLCRKFQSTFSSAAKTQLVIPRNTKEIVLQQTHDNLGHLGIHKTTESVKERFYWPGYELDIELWVRECLQFQQHNAPQPTPKAPLETIKANHSFEKVSWDIMGPLPTSSKGKKYILVVTDIFSKWVEAFALRSTDTETLATVLVNEVICRYGVPSTVHSDQGANFHDKSCHLISVQTSRN